MKNNITVGLAIGLLIAILSTLLAWGQRNQAISQANVAVMAEKTAKTQRADLRAYMAKGEHYLLLHADVAFWIQELEAGRNPFDTSVLATLRGK